jgi:prepilin-type N-terminal cleavage/methylation domain-containing protein
MNTDPHCAHAQGPAPAGRRGFSLAETLVALAVFGLLMFAVFQISLFMARSQDVTTSRLMTLAKGKYIGGQLGTMARDCDMYFLYTNYGTDGLGDVNTLPDGFVNTFYQPTIHQGPGSGGNFLVMVWFHTDTDTADEVPPPVSRIVGIYSDPLSTASATDEYLPVRMFDKEFTQAEGVVGVGNVIFEDLLPAHAAYGAPGPIGYAKISSLSNPSAASPGLFYINPENAANVTLSLPIKYRDSDEAAAYRIDTSLLFSNML